MKNKSLWISAVAALAVAAALAGCGSTTYFAGRTLPPSGLRNRVLIAVQNPSAMSAGALTFVDAYYDIRFKYNSANTAPAFSIGGYSGALPITIQNMPEEQMGAVYGNGDGSFSLISYAKESGNGAVGGLIGRSSSVFLTRNQAYAFAASHNAGVLTVVNQANKASYNLSLPGIYRVSVNPGGSVVLAFVQNSDYVYYPRQLTALQTTTYSGSPKNWPTGAVDCEPQTNPLWCLFQALGSDGTRLSFNHPIKAVFSADGGTAYILSCGPECGGTAPTDSTFPATASVTPLPVAPLIFLVNQQSGLLPTQTELEASVISTPGGASNALLDGSTLYVAGQALNSGYWGGNLTVVDLSKTPAAVSKPISISDGAPGDRIPSRMILADDHTLWIGMIQCTTGYRANNNLPYGCLTMFNTATNAATLLPYIGDATGIAAVTGLHKIYTAEGGQVYIYSTVDGSAIDNQNVTVTGTAYDVAYMDADSDANNTVY